MSAMSGMMGSLASVSARQQSAAEQRRMNDYNIAVANDNARISRLQAEDAEKQSRRKEKEHRMELAQKKGRLKTKFAASNVELSGSPVSQLVDNARWGEYDAEKIREEGRRNAWNYNVKANKYQNDVNKLRSNNFSSSGMGAFTNLLSGATSAARSIHGSF